MKNGSIILVMLLLSISAKAQHNNGFFGKKMFFDFSGKAAMPLISSLFEDDYYKKTGTGGLTLSNDHFNYGFSGTIGYAFQHNRAISINVSQMYGNISGPEQIVFTPSDALYSSDKFYIETDHENLRVKTLMISPTFHFSNNSSLLPVGISHEVGIGFRAASIVERDYVYKASPFYTSYTDQSGNYHQIDLSTTAEANAFIDSLVQADGPYIDYKRKYIGPSFTYALRIRKPISDILALNMGLKYALNLTRSEDKIESGYYYTTTQDRMLKFQRRSIITFDFGLTLLF